MDNAMIVKQLEALSARFATALDKVESELTQDIESDTDVDSIREVLADLDSLIATLSGKPQDL